MRYRVARHAFLSMSLPLLALLIGCSSESRIIHAGAILLQPREWSHVRIDGSARADISQVCVTLPVGYHYNGATDRGVIVRDTATHREVIMSAHFIDSKGTSTNVSDIGSGGPYSRADGRGTCFKLPPRTRGMYTAVDLTASDTLTVGSISWDTYYRTALF